MCKYTHIFLTKGCSLSKNKSKQKLYLQILFLVFLCNKHWGCVGTAFFFLVPCIIFVHAAHRKEMHTIYKLNILFISKAFKVQSCIHQLSWTQFQAGWITSCTTGREDRCCFCTETPSSALACISFSWLPVFPPSAGEAMVFFFFYRTTNIFSFSLLKIMLYFWPLTPMRILPAFIVHFN